MPLKEELDRAVPQHELLDVSASKAKGELGQRGGLAGRQLPSREKGVSNSSSVSIILVLVLLLLTVVFKTAVDN